MNNITFIDLFASFIVYLDHIFNDVRGFPNLIHAKDLQWLVLCRGLFHMFPKRPY